MIRSFHDKKVEQIARGKAPKGFGPDLLKEARQKLALLDAASHIRDLSVPPGNRLEALRGNRKGQHSIRINDQWRICFVWKDGAAEDVEIVDYH